MLTHLSGLILGTLLCLTFVEACAAQTSTAPINIAEITANATTYAGKAVVLSGEYRGWEAGHGSPPITRSDWILKDATGAIYVTGKAPTGFDPQKDIGQKLTVQGIVRVKDGKAYIEAEIVK